MAMETTLSTRRGSLSLGILFLKLHLLVPAPRSTIIHHQPLPHRLQRHTTLRHSRRSDRYMVDHQALPRHRQVAATSGHSTTTEVLQPVLAPPILGPLRPTCRPRTTLATTMAATTRTITDQMAWIVHCPPADQAMPAQRVSSSLLPWSVGGSRCMRMVANGAISPQAPNLPPLRIRDHRITQVSADASVGA